MNECNPLSGGADGIAEKKRAAREAKDKFESMQKEREAREAGAYTRSLVSST